jgi:hypothetical protein
MYSLEDLDLSFDKARTTRREKSQLAETSARDFTLLLPRLPSDD